MFTLQKNPDKADFQRTGKSEISNKDSMYHWRFWTELNCSSPYPDWDVCGCGCEAVRGQLEFLFTAPHFPALPLGRGLFNATENCRNMSAALFDFLSASKTPAGSGNESANRTHEERHATHD